MSALFVVFIPLLPVIFLIAFIVGEFDESIGEREQSINDIMHNKGNDAQ